MSKWLKDTAKTGDKIMNSKSLFQYKFIEKEEMGENVYLYKFNWNFDKQTGYINIKYKDKKISNSSLIDSNNDSPHKFDRPLGLYNDSTLFDLFVNMMNSINVEVEGIYSE